MRRFGLLVPEFMTAPDADLVVLEAAGRLYCCYTNVDGRRVIVNTEAACERCNVQEDGTTVSIEPGVVSGGRNAP